MREAKALIAAMRMAGAPAEMILAAIENYQEVTPPAPQASSGKTPAESRLEKLRAYDRERKRKKKDATRSGVPTEKPAERKRGDIEITPDLKHLEVGKESVIARATPSPNRFPELWGVYPRRAGTNSRKKAEQIYTRNVAKGVPEQEMIDGARRYAVFCDTEGKTGTQYVMQTTTWLNREEWHNDFTPSRKTGLDAHFDDLRAGLERNRDPDDGAGGLEPPDETGLPF